MVKKLNLLPQEIKNKYMNRYLIFAAVSVCIGVALILASQYIQIGILSWQTDKIIASNEKYDNEKENIANLEERIKKYNEFLKDYEKDCFPFSLFMYDLEVYRPSDVFLISVDSLDRLINEGIQKEQEGEKTEGSQEEVNQEQQEKNDDTNEEQEGEETVEEENNITPQISYTEDLSGQEIVIRGYGKNQKSISQFIYDITHLSYIGSSKITAVEEHKMDDGTYNLFEITVTGGAY